MPIGAFFMVIATFVVSLFLHGSFFEKDAFPGRSLESAAGWGDVLPSLVVAICCIPIVIHLFSFVVNAQRRDMTPVKLLSLYLESIAIFAHLYFFYIFYVDELGITNITNYYGARDEAGLISFQDSAMRETFLILYNCFHFSIVNQTTLGYGDMLPANLFMKMLVDTQIIINVYFITVVLSARMAPAPDPPG